MACNNKTYYHTVWGFKMLCMLLVILFFFFIHSHYFCNDLNNFFCLFMFPKTSSYLTWINSFPSNLSCIAHKKNPANISTENFLKCQEFDEILKTHNILINPIEDIHVKMKGKKRLSFPQQMSKLTKFDIVWWREWGTLW